MGTRIRWLSLWVALVVLLAITVYGFLHQGLLHQETWTPTGIRRVLTFAACYALCFAAFAIWKPGLFFATVLLAVLAYSAAAVGPIPLLIAGLIPLSSLVLGQTILVRLSKFEAGSGSGAMLAMLLGLSIYMFAVSIAALVPVNYPATYVAALAAPLLWNFRAAVDWFSKIPLLLRPIRLTRGQHGAACLLVFVLLLHWLVVLEPEAGPDGLAVHLVVPSSVALTHQWAFDVTKHLWAVMPMGADWCFTLAYLLGGEAAARLLNLILFLCITALLLTTIRKWLPLAPALLTVTMFAATPLVQLVTGSLFAENLWTLLCLGALVSLERYREGPDAFLYLAFALAGAAASTKFGALAFLPPFVLIACWSMYGKHPRSLIRSAKTISVTLACFLFFAAPPYVTASVKTGDPVFPYLPQIFSSRYAVAAGSGSPAGPKAQLTLSTLYDLTFHTRRFWEVQDGAIGFQYLLFLPLSILLLRRKWPRFAMLSGFTLVLFAVLALSIQPDVRYLYPAFPLATLFIAGALSNMRSFDYRLYRVALALAAVVVGLDLYFLPSSNWMFKDFVSNPASRRARAEYVLAHAPERNLVAYLNQAHAGKAVAFFESSSIAGLQGPALTTGWHNLEFYRRILAATSPADCFRVLRDYGVSLIVAPSPGSPITITTTPIETFLKNCTEPEAHSGNFYAGRLKDTCLGDGDDSGLAAPPGEYDDFDARIRYRGVWVRGRFSEASRGTLTYSNDQDAALLFRFDGAEVVYVYTKAFNRGIAQISLDGRSQGAIDLYSPSLEWKTAAPFRAQGPGPHTLEIQVTGRKTPSATDAFVDVDALIVR
jgi:hypothetical protein